MDEQLEILIVVAARLDRAGIPYMVSGSVALGLYAQPRMTRDIDIVVEMGPADAARVAALFQADFDCDQDALLDSIARKTLFNIIHFETLVKVDFIFRKDSEYRRMEFRRRRVVEISGHSVWVVSREDLLLSKLAWAKDSHSELQLRDVKSLIDAASDLDWDYVEQWVDVLDVRKMLEAVRR